MRRLWDNPQQVQDFGSNAKARFHKLFTAERMCAKTTQVYRELLKTAGATHPVKTH